MKRNRPILAALACCGLYVSATLGLVAAVAIPGAVMQGCAGQSTVKSYSYTQDAFINAGNRVITLRSAGKINDQDYKVVVLPIMREIDAALDKWDAAIKSGDPNAASFANLASAALERLSAYLVTKAGAQ